MKKISLRLDAEVHERIKLIAQTENKSMNTVMVSMLENFIKEHKQNDRKQTYRVQTKSNA